MRKVPFRYAEISSDGADSPLPKKAANAKIIGTRALTALSHSRKLRVAFSLLHESAFKQIK
jgi:hypothetical protein